MEAWDEIILECNKEIERVKEALAMGAGGSFSEYQNLVGYCKGIIFSRETLTNIIKKRSGGFDNEEEDN
tara:strand:+ start:971 stop:1177 length:207 start_codon:yes stop_codon:yes gene_type:complete